MTDEQVNVE